METLSDENIDTVDDLVIVLNDAVSEGIPCTAAEKSSLQSSTSSKNTAAKGAANTYAEEKANQISSLYDEVAQQISLINSANNELKSSNEPTASAVTLVNTTPNASATTTTTTSTTTTTTTLTSTATTTTTKSGSGTRTGTGSGTNKKSTASSYYQYDAKNVWISILSIIFHFVFLNEERFLNN